MTRLEFGPFVLDVDVEQTQTFYQTGPGIDCNCQGCRNFPLAVTALPEEALSFFRSLGIDPKKPAEAYVNCAQAGGTLLYGGFYHLCGRLVRGQGGWRTVASNGENKTSVWERESCYLISDGFFVAFTEDVDLLEEGFPVPVLQMEIDACLPWMLEEENDYP